MSEQTKIDTSNLHIADYTALYLDPESRAVYTWNERGSCPEGVWHKRHASLGHVNGAVDPTWLRDYLDGDDALQDICAGYLGSEWDGRNHVGRWTQEALEQIESFQASLHLACEQAPKVWSAADWIGGDAEMCKKDALLTGSVKTWASNEARGADAILDTDDLDAVMRRMLGEDLEEALKDLSGLDEEADEDKIEQLQERIEKIRAALA